MYGFLVHPLVSESVFIHSGGHVDKQPQDRSLAAARSQHSGDISYRCVWFFGSSVGSHIGVYPYGRACGQAAARLCSQAAAKSYRSGDISYRCVWFLGPPVGSYIGVYPFGRACGQAALEQPSSRPQAAYFSDWCFALGEFSSIESSGKRDEGPMI